MERRKVICPRPQIDGDDAESRRNLVSLTLVRCSLHCITSHRVNNYVLLSLQGSNSLRAYDSTLSSHPLISKTSWALGIIGKPRRWHDNQSKILSPHLTLQFYPFLVLIPIFFWGWVTQKHTIILNLLSSQVRKRFRDLCFCFWNYLEHKHGLKQRKTYGTKNVFG